MSTGPPSAHHERALTDRQWSAIRTHLRPMDFDDHVGDTGSLRTDWIEQLLWRAGVSGCVGIMARRPPG